MFYRRIGVVLIALAGLGFLSLAASTSAQGPTPKKAGADSSRINWNEKKIAFDMKGKPWEFVIRWFANQANMPFASQYTYPAGGFTFINPEVNGKQREYSLTEIFDILNEILISQHQHMLLRRDLTLTMVPADKIDDTLVPFLKVEDLPERGKTELVRVIIKLKKQNAEDFAIQVKRMLGDFGHVTPLPDTNQLILRAPVSNLRFALDIIVPADETGDSELTYSHKCKYIRALAAKTVLSESLGSSRQIVET